MNVKLERKIKISKFKVILDIGQKVERTDIIALLLIAQANNNQLSREIVCRDFIFREHNQMAETILRRCIEYEVLDNEYKITQEGFQAIRDGMVYRYHNGRFYIYVTDDPLIPQRILDIEFVNENINFRNEIREPGENKINLIDIPQWLKDVEKVEDKQLFNIDKTEINVKSISEKVELLEKIELIVTINLTKKSCILKTSGIFNDQREIHYFPKFQAIWEELMANRITDWDWNNNKLKVHCNLTDNEKISFRKKISFKSPNINNFGSFDSLSIEVEIKPKTEADANEWANWLLCHDINDFLFDTAFVERKKQISMLFPDFNVDFLSHKALVEEMKGNLDLDNISNEYWFVQAPIDLIPIAEKENN